MSLWRRLFSGSTRKARRAEAQGRYRDAAAAYAEGGQAAEAARALRFEAAHTDDPEVRRAALLDALCWLEDDAPERAQIDGELGDMELVRAHAQGVHGAEDRRRLERAAEQLEAAGQGARAATAYELLERPDEAARCLEQAGEVKRLELLLESQSETEGAARVLRAALKDHDAALALGARREALAALVRGLAELPGQTDLLRARAALEARFFERPALTLRYAGKRLRVLGRLPVELGREGIFPLRGPGISRRHVGLRRHGDRFSVRDLDSRNGTSVDGLLLESEVELSGAARIGLGEHLHVRVELHGAGLALTVLDGLDRGLRGLVSMETLALPNLPASLAFPDGYPTLIPDRGTKVRLGGRDVVTPIELLQDDGLELGGTRVELEP